MTAGLTITMTRTAPTVEEILSDFSQPTVPKVSGGPSYKTIYIIYKILQGNSASVKSNAGGGTHGHLALGQAIINR
eukprot:3367516-Ditylum_brightwellii.AAC.2